MRSFSLLLGLLCFQGTLGHSAEPDSSTLQALEQTKKLLQDRKSLEKLLANDPLAEQADAAVTQMAGEGAHRAELYAITAKIFEGVVLQSNGDPAVMQKLLEEAKKDPAKFFSKLSVEDQRRIQELAKKLESSTAAGRSGRVKPRP